MSKRLRTIIAEENADVVEEGEEQEQPPETRRTRSGRRVRTPAALLDSETTVRTPTRRTRKTVTQEKPPDETTVISETVATGVCEEPEPVPVSPPAEETLTDADRVEVNGGGVVSVGEGPVPANEAGPKSSESVPKKKKSRPASAGTQTPVIPLGKPKSGRVWKNRNKQRFSAVVRDKQLCSSWEKKMAAKRDKDMVKRYTLQLKEEKAKQKEDKRKRREDNLKRRAENERKAEIVQVIKNTTKIKRMKKKQLRKIEKRDTLALLQKTNKQNAKAVKGQKSNKVEQIST